MMGDRQSQKSGDSSTNIQARGNVVIGPTVSEVRDIAMDVYKANFYELGERAADVARKRAESLVDSFLKEVVREGQTRIPEAENPDFRYVLFSAQREYARTGDEDLGELLVQLLVDRTKVEERDLEQIVLNESLAVAPKLTPDQLAALSLVFILKYTAYEGLNSLAGLHAYLDKLILPFVAGASRKQSAYQHLEYAGCGTISVLETDAHVPFTRNYAGLLCEGFTEEELQSVGLAQEAKSQLIIPCLHNDSLLQVGTMNEKSIDEACAQLGVEPELVGKLKELQGQKIMRPEAVKDYLINARPQMAQFFEVWDETPMKRMTLTSVGIAIAHANIKRQTGDASDLSIWI